MLSIIICSKNGAISTKLKNNIDNTIGCVYELVVIDNSKNDYSIFSAYNEGVQLSNFEFLCFVHEDVEFSGFNWGLKLIQHLKNEQTGLVGVAGGQAALRIPYGWTAFQPHYTITHLTSSNTDSKINKKEISPLNHDIAENVVLLDGVFLGAQKNLFNFIHFDQNFTGFHGYDLDISLQATCLGFQNKVIYDIDISHYSLGNFNNAYYINLFKLYEKWVNKLPLFIDSYSTNEIEKILYKVEKKTLNKLTKKLVRANMTNKEIIPTLSHYIHIIGNSTDKFFLFLLPMKLHYIRISSIIRRKKHYDRVELNI